MLEGGISEDRGAGDIDEEVLPAAIEVVEENVRGAKAGVPNEVSFFGDDIARVEGGLCNEEFGHAVADFVVHLIEVRMGGAPREVISHGHGRAVGRVVCNHGLGL